MALLSGIKYVAQYLLCDTHYMAYIDGGRGRFSNFFVKVPWQSQNAHHKFQKVFDKNEIKLCWE